MSPNFWMKQLLEDVVVVMGAVPHIQPYGRRRQVNYQSNTQANVAKSTIYYALRLNDAGQC